MTIELSPYFFQSINFFMCGSLIALGVVACTAIGCATACYLRACRMSVTKSESSTTVDCSREGCPLSK
jgi:hypothetical protein